MEEDVAPHVLHHLLENNRAWAARALQQDPEFFCRLLHQQRPEYLWIGCADSRVPANDIVGLLPGQLFVHRNVANVVIQTDLNCLSVLQYAVDVLRIRHIIVCGHYGCGGVLAALRGDRLGLVDNWLLHVRSVYERNAALVDALVAESDRHDRLCELNVVEQVSHVCQTTILQDAWARGQCVSVHGWIYGLKDGLLNDLGMSVRASADLSAAQQTARARMSARVPER